MKNELPYLLAAAQSEGVKILPVIVEACNFTFFSSLSKYQAVNDPAKPLSLLSKSKREPIWAKVAATTKDSLDEFKTKALGIEASQKDAPSPKKHVKWENVATLFWLGNDLMWIQDRMNQVAPPAHVLEGVENAIHYVKELGFQDRSFPIQQLTLAAILLQQLVGISTEEHRSFLQGHYRGIHQYIDSVKWFIHGLTSDKQRGFEKRRVLGNPSAHDI